MPFDEQKYMRIRLETEAINLILSKVRDGIYTLIVLPVHIKEIQAIEDTIERVELQMILENLGESIRADMAKIRKRAADLVNLGFGVAGAAHIAFSEQAAAQFVSCDDRLVRKCIYSKIGIWCGTPIAFCDKEGLR